MIFINVNIRPSYAGTLQGGSHQFRNYGGVGTTTQFFTYPKLRPQFTGGSFFGAFNYRTGEVLAPIIITPFLQTFFQIFGKDGGLKKTWYYNQDATTPAMNLKIEVTKNGSGAGTLKLAYLDFPILSEDYMIVFVAGQVFYKGFFENDVDVSLPFGRLSPYSKRFKEILYTGSFVLEDPIDILETVVTATASETGITWDDAEVNFGDILDPITVDYEDESVYSIVEEIVDRGFNKYWGVNNDNVFFVKEQERTTATARYYLDENPLYEDIEVKEDYSKIKMTEAAVYARRTDNISGQDVTQTKRIGTVGTGGSYPVLDLRKKVRKIQGRLTAPEVLPTDQAVLDWGYARLQQKEAIVRKTIMLKNWDIVRETLNVGNTIQVQDKDKLTILDIDKTQSLTGWTGATLDVAGGRFQQDAISIQTGYLDLGKQTQWYKQENVGIYIKATVDQIVDISFSDNPAPSPGDTTTISIINTGSFNYYSIPVKKSFRYIIFDTAGSDIITDEINVLCYHRTNHVDIVSSIKVQYNPDSIKSDVKLGDLIQEESFDMFETERKVRILEHINRI